MSEYPRKNDAGETVWACCESTIGPTCNHKQPPGSTPYVVVVYSRWSEHVEYVAGPFASLDEAHAWTRAHLDRAKVGYIQYSVQKLTLAIPDWVSYE